MLLEAWREFEAGCTSRCVLSAACTAGQGRAGWRISDFPQLLALKCPCHHA